jgi:hypothetical protein
LRYIQLNISTPKGKPFFNMPPAVGANFIRDRSRPTVGAISKRDHRPPLRSAPAPSKVEGIAEFA